MWKVLSRLRIADESGVVLEGWVAELGSTVFLFEFSEWTLPAVAGPFASYDDAAIFLLKQEGKSGKHRVEVSDAVTNMPLYVSFVSV